MRARGPAPERLPRDRPGRLLATSRCPGCGLELPATGGPAHAYIGASPECWALYGELLAEGYADAGGPGSLVADAYAAQHPGVPGRRAEQSVAVHLGVLYLVLVRDMDIDHARRRRGALAEPARPFGWLEPPSSLGGVTIQDVLAASCHEEHDARVRDWGLNVWSAWAPHHETISAWLAEDR